MNIPTGKVILASGGLDSFLTWSLFARDSINLFVDLGQPYAVKELESLCALEKAIPDFKFIRVKGPSIGTINLRGIIPMRNAVLVLMAAHYGNDIMLGILDGEVNSDKSPEFLQAIAATMNISGRGQYWNDYQATVYTVSSPVSHHTKNRTDSVVS